MCSDYYTPVLSFTSRWPPGDLPQSAAQPAKYISPFGEDNHPNSKPVMPMTLEPYFSLPNTPDTEETIRRSNGVALVGNVAGGESHI